MWKRKSPYGVKETLDRLEDIISENEEILRFARVDQAEILRSAGHPARSCEMLLFENPTLASVMIGLNPEAAFELPIRALAWQDEAGQTWLRVTDPEELDRVAALNGADGAISKIRTILGEMLNRTLEPS